MELRRGIDTTLHTAISNPKGFNPAVMLQSYWPSGFQRIHSGLGRMTFNGETFYGAGHIIESVTVGPEGGGGVPPETTLRLVSAIEEVLDAANDQTRDAEVSIWVGAVTKPGGSVLIGVPLLCFFGRICENEAVMEPGFASQLAELSIGAIAGPGVREKAALFHSDEDQKSKYPTDTGFERLAWASRWRDKPPTFPEPVV